MVHPKSDHLMLSLEEAKTIPEIVDIKCFPFHTWEIAFTLYLLSNRSSIKALLASYRKPLTKMKFNKSSLLEK